MITTAEWRQILEAFDWRCAYCQMPAIYLPQGLQKDHIIPKSAGGSEDSNNICSACPNCNAHKAGKTFGIDPDSDRRVTLFNPRKQTWTKHFTWDTKGTRIIGRTKTGRATVHALKMNSKPIVTWRRIIVRIGGYPPRI